MNDWARCVIPTACWLGFVMPSNCLAEGADELVIQNETGQRLVLQVTPSHAAATEEPTLFEVAPRKWNSMKLKADDPYTITLQWIALEGHRTYEFRADDVRLREFIRISKTRPTARLVEFRLVARSEGTPLQRKDLSDEWQWPLTLLCTTTRREAIFNFPRLAIADPIRPIPSARILRRLTARE